MIVVDTNIVAYLIIDERSDLVALLERDRDWVAPTLWRSEFRNVLATLMRAGGIDLRQAVDLADLAEELLAGGDYAVPSHRILTLAQGSGCSAYDCEFVALAEDLAVPLVTSDLSLLSAFPDVAMTPDSHLAA